MGLRGRRRAYKYSSEWLRRLWGEMGAGEDLATGYTPAREGERRDRSAKVRMESSGKKGSLKVRRRRRASPLNEEDYMYTHDMC